jgi:hypothetical protein
MKLSDRWREKPAKAIELAVECGGHEFQICEIASEE